MTKFNENLRDLILKNNLTMNQLARNIEVSTSTISDYCGNKLLPSIENLIKISNFFECSTDYLLGLSEENKNSNINYKYKFNMNVFNQRFDIAKKNKTTYEIAKLTNIPSSVIYNWKAENRQPSIRTLIKLADAFPVSIDYLIGRKD